MSFFEEIGFNNHPFAQTNADEEPHLAEYFVPPPFFDGVVGDYENPSSCMVLAPRGAGKSAQRRMIEEWASDNHVLAITYDRFEFDKGQSVGDITLQYHMRNIITRVLIGYLSFLRDSPTLIENLSKQKRDTISTFAYSYLGDLKGDELREILKELKSLPQRFKDFWKENVGVLDSVLQMLMKNFGLSPIDLPNAKQEDKKLTETYKHQLEVLYDIASEAGISSIYILIDKVDETEKTGGDPEATYSLIRPLARDLELLSLRGYGFKFFLWDRIEPHFREDARPDRVSQYKLNWSRSNLEEVLSQRLQFFSNGEVEYFGQIVKTDTKYSIDSMFALLANGSPRNLVRLCEKIFSAQAEIDRNSAIVSWPAVERGVITYCKQITRELYGEDVVKDLQRAERELFTINYLSNYVFKTAHKNTSRNRVTSWKKSGVLRQVGTVSVETSKRPLNFYYVSDPAMIRLINRSDPLIEFFDDRWIMCDHCMKDNLVDISIIPDGNEPLCLHCNRSLF